MTSAAPDTSQHCNPLLQHLEMPNFHAGLGDDFADPVAIQSLENPRLVDRSPEAAALLDLDEANSQELVSLLNGDCLDARMQPIASVYAGHQFGSWVPQLGDGRAHLLGQVRGKNGQLWELQLKGSGQTPYSRFGDGRAVLRSSIREYLCSEAMAGLGIPTTRALALIDSDSPVQRERTERGAIVLRMAPSFIRFGHFELFASRHRMDMVDKLLDHILLHHRPELREADNPALALFEDVIERTARLMAQWQLQGFCHGVMNTDNMSMLGLTIDYGPFGFLDTYNPAHICNHSDHGGRYSWSRQADIGWWNLACLGNSLLERISLKQAQASLEVYRDHYQAGFRSLMKAKLGLQDLPGVEDDSLIEDWLQLLYQQSADFSLAFRSLSEFDESAGHPLHKGGLKPSAALNNWLGRYRQRLQKQADTMADRHSAMQAVNPLYLLRNHLAQRAIDRAEQGDYREVARLRKVLATPFTRHEGADDLAEPPPSNEQGIAVSCSS